jgi:uncharacterized membrane protein YqgA involved in biofilm formation
LSINLRSFSVPQFEEYLYTHSMLGTVVNFISVAVGSILGVVFGSRIKEGFQETIFIGIGIFVLILGIKMGLETERIFYSSFALMFGGLLGNLLDIEGRVAHFGEFLKKKFVRTDDGKNFGTAFLDASVLFCSGAIALVGSFRAGMEGDLSLLLTKSMLDGFVSIFLAARMGIGVAFSALTILVYQGGLTLFSFYLSPLLSPALMSELTAVGGMIVVMIALNLLGLKKIKAGNFIPALAIVCILVAVEETTGLSFGSLSL